MGRGITSVSKSASRVTVGRNSTSSSSVTTRRAWVVLLLLSAVFLSVASPALVNLGSSRAAAGPTPMDVVGAAGRSAGGGWSTTGAGAVVPFGGAPFFGDASGAALSKSIVGMAGTPDGRGYWLVAADGGIFSFGNAVFYGSTGNLRLNQPIVGMAGTPDGRGYWLVAADGGIFSFGNAGFYGSTGNLRLNQPIVGMAGTPDGRGYWLVAADGGIFSFGNAGFYGSTGNLRLNQPIVGMAGTPDGRGYWLVAADGGIFSFGNAGFYGSDGSVTGFRASAIVPQGSGYLVVSSSAAWSSFGQTKVAPTVSKATTTPPVPTTHSSTPCASDARPVGDTAPIPCVEGSSLVDSNGKPLRLVGVDASGTEDACIQDKGFAWGASNEVEALTIASWHTNVVRVPLNEDCWLGINGAPPLYSGSAYQAWIKRWVTALNRAGLIAILDLQWSAPGSYSAQQQWSMADEDHSVTFWTQVAADYVTDPSVIFDLYNEPTIGLEHPASSDWTCWLDGCTTTDKLCPLGSSTHCSTVHYTSAGMQQMVEAVRNAGARQPIMVASLDWAGDPCGIHDSGGNGGICQWSAIQQSDPSHQLIVSFHAYNWTACATIACWNNDVGLVATQAPVVTGELGEEDCTAKFIDTFMAWADQHNVSYLANSWQPPSPDDPSTCVAGQDSPGSVINLKLLSSWSGGASRVAPEGAAFAAHLAVLAQAS